MVNGLVFGQLAVELDEIVTRRPLRDERVRKTNPRRLVPGEVRCVAQVAGPIREKLRRIRRQSFCKRRQRRQLLLLVRLHFSCCLSLIMQIESRKV